MREIFSDCVMRWKCICSYDGTMFHGWQSQVCKNTIQDFIESRLLWIFKQPIRIHGCSRTDAGVHAHYQVFHFDASWPHDTQKLLQAFQSGLPSTIKIISVEEVSEDFHARFSAINKTYHYHIVEDFADPFTFRYRWSLGKRLLDIDIMNELAKNFIGEHDFSAFSAKSNAPHSESSESTIKNISCMHFLRNDKNITFITTGSGYLYKMVRSLVGTLVSVGLHKSSQDDILEIFLSKKRNNLIETAPAAGLFLQKISYPPDTDKK